MNILVDNGCHNLRNMGDVAMLQVGVARLQHLWPEAIIMVVTEAPDLLNKYCPGAYPVDAKGRNQCLSYETILGRFGRFMPNIVTDKIEHYHWPVLAELLLRLKLKYKACRRTNVRTFLDSLMNVDLVVISGGGDFTDSFEASALTLLKLLELASRLGKTTALLGQGFGPINKSGSKLLSKSKEILPMVDLIFSREKRMGPALLDLLGVKRSNVNITGDDAIELAYNAQVTTLGNEIGVSLRVAYYSGVKEDHIDTIRNVLQDAATRRNTRLIHIPISLDANESDVETLGKIIVSDHQEPEVVEHLDSPLKVIRQSGRCRLVVTGSYHGAVFALAQGIPVVALAQSPYYIDKFLGLSDQFEEGFRTIVLDKEDLVTSLSAAIEDAWNSAERIRLKLLKSAKQQIECGLAANQRLYAMVEAKMAKGAH